MRWLLAVTFVSVSLSAQDATLEHARQVNLERAANMPNFVADEIVSHYLGRDPSRWRRDWTIQDEITLKGNQVTRRNVVKNGKAWDGKGQDPARTYGLPATGFAAALMSLFDPGCPTTLELAGQDQLRGKEVSVYRFRSPANGCFGNLFGPRAYNAARSGRILIDAASGDLLQFEEEASGFPAGFVFWQRNQVMIWDQVKIGEASHWLPVSADFVWKHGDGTLSRSVVEYKNHRHFEAATNITFK